MYPAIHPGHLGTPNFTENRAKLPISGLCFFPFAKLTVNVQSKIGN